MKKALLSVVLLAFVTSTHAQLEKTPYEMFSAKNLTKDKVEVTITSVDNVEKSCEAESRRRGKGGFGTPMEACSFWNHNGLFGKTCDIYISKKVNMWTLGHELRHCFEGSFH